MKDALRTVAEAAAVFAFIAGICAGGMVFDRPDAPAPRYAEARR